MNKSKISKPTNTNSKDTIIRLNKLFEECAYDQDGVAYWQARELQELLGYTKWRNFLNAVNKAKESCETTGEAVSDHFVDVSKMVGIGSGAERKQDDRATGLVWIRLLSRKEAALLTEAIIKALLPIKT